MKVTKGGKSEKHMVGAVEASMIIGMDYLTFVSDVAATGELFEIINPGITQ